jgi:hypothetical protein
MTRMRMALEYVEVVAAARSSRARAAAARQRADALRRESRQIVARWRSARTGYPGRAPPPGATGSRPAALLSVGNRGVQRAALEDRDPTDEV